MARLFVLIYESFNITTPYTRRKIILRHKGLLKNYYIYFGRYSNSKSDLTLEVKDLNFTEKVNNDVQLHIIFNALSIIWCYTPLIQNIKII